MWTDLLDNADRPILIEFDRDISVDCNTQAKDFAYPCLGYSACNTQANDFVYPFLGYSACNTEVNDFVYPCLGYSACNTQAEDFAYPYLGFSACNTQARILLIHVWVTLPVTLKQRILLIHVWASLTITQGKHPFDTNKVELKPIEVLLNNQDWSFNYTTFSALQYLLTILHPPILYRFIFKYAQYRRENDKTAD